MYGCAAIVSGNSWFLNCYGKRGVLPAGSRKDTSFCHFYSRNYASRILRTCSGEMSQSSEISDSLRPSAESFRTFFVS